MTGKPSIHLTVARKLGEEDRQRNEAAIRGQIAEQQAREKPVIDNDKRDPYAEAWGLEEDHPS